MRGVILAGVAGLVAGNITIGAVKGAIDSVYTKQSLPVKIAVSLGLAGSVGLLALSQ